MRNRIFALCFRKSISVWGLFFLCACICLQVSAGSLPNSGRVVAVFDGDTIMLEGGYKVRYLGIDAPEIEHDDRPADCYGYEAKQFNAALVMGKIVSLRYDSTQVTDRYGRLCAYIFLPNGNCVNEILVREGYAWVLRKPESFRLLNQLLRLQDKAISDKKGIWGKCAKKPEAYYIGNKRSFVFHRPSCPFGQSMSPRNVLKLRTREDAFRKGFYPCRRCKP